MTETTARPALDLALSIDEQTAEALIARFIQQDPNRYGRHQASVDGGEGGPQVWIIINYLRAGYDVAHVADAYDLSDEAVRAAVAYYERHRELIDAKILLYHEARHARDASPT